MALGTEVGLCPGHIVLDRDPPPPKGAQQPPGSISIVAKRSPISATAELLLSHMSGNSVLEALRVTRFAVIQEEIS